MVASSNGPAQRKRVYRQCCADIIKGLNGKLKQQKVKGKAAFGINTVAEQLQYLTGLSSATLRRLITSKEILPEMTDEKRERTVEMNLEDEALLRPCIIAMVLSKTTPTMTKMHHKLQHENEGWNWGRTSCSPMCLPMLSLWWTERRITWR